MRSSLQTETCQSTPEVYSIEQLELIFNLHWVYSQKAQCVFFNKAVLNTDGVGIMINVRTEKFHSVNAS